MRITNKRNGEPVEPLQALTIGGVKEGLFWVTDSLGREYYRCQAKPELTFKVGGALGYHTAVLADQGGKILDKVTFRVIAQTRLNDQGGQFRRLLDMLYYTMAAEPMGHYTRYRGRLYYYFVGWLRDHVHVMKGMKYFEDCLKDGIDLYRDSQREDGMIWDNHHHREPPRMGPNHWSRRFSYGDFHRVFEDGTAEFTRIPVEADVEYLFVEGLYYTWKATGDDGWMADSLDAAMRAMEYCVTSPYRWSHKFGLIKRGHTIDTWDFQNEGDRLSDYVGWPDIMAVHPDKTRFGIMFGDNTGYAAACDYLSEMLEHVGRSEDAKRYRVRGQDIRRRLDQASWNGRFFTHHVPEDPSYTRDLGVDEATQVSLSNAYSLNRGISHEQCVAIINTYLDLKDHLPADSPGEWYTIYPPFPKGYGGHSNLWQYMNSSVTPIVAGELAHGAFQHGYEAYAVDILHRLIFLGQKYGNRFNSSYTGAFPPSPARNFTQLNLSPYANVGKEFPTASDVPAWIREGSADTQDFPRGEQTFEDIPFTVLDPATSGGRACIGLSKQEGYVAKLDIPVGKTGSLYLLHGLHQVGGDGVGGLVTLTYTDQTQHNQYLVEGYNAFSLTHWMIRKPLDPNSRVAWHGWDDQTLEQSVTLTGLDNPYPEREIDHITLTAAENGAMWFVLGITLSDAEVTFKPNPISFGIPDGWSAAAVAYALIEGLAGVVDKGVAYDKVCLSPRWPAAQVNQAEAVIGYPASGGYVAYRYDYDSVGRVLAIELTGSGDSCDCHVLLPEGVEDVLKVEIGDEQAPFTLVTIEASRYVDFPVMLPGPRSIIILCR